MQTIVRNVDGWGSPIGFSATNMRYVTITKSRFYNNARRHRPQRPGRGEVPAAGGQRDHRQRDLLEQLQLPPGQAAVPGPRPTGTGRARPDRHRHPAVRRPRHTGSRTTGSTATSSPAFAATRQLPACRRTRRPPRCDRNIVRNNAFGLNGTDENGCDIVYGGNGSDNCFTIGGDRHRARPVDARARAQGKNTFSQAAQDQMVQWIGRERAQWLEAAPPPAEEGHQAAGGVRRVRRAARRCRRRRRALERGAGGRRPSRRARRSGSATTTSCRTR